MSTVQLLKHYIDNIHWSSERSFKNIKGIYIMYLYQER